MDGKCHMPATSSITSELCCISPGRITTLMIKSTNRDRIKNTSIDLSICTEEFFFQTTIISEDKQKNFQDIMIKPACSVCLLLHLLQQNIKTCEQLMRMARRSVQQKSKKILLSLSLAHCKSVCLQAVTLSFYH